MGSVPKSIQILRTIFGTIVNRHFVPFMVQYSRNQGQPISTRPVVSPFKHKGASTARRDGNNKNKGDNHNV